MSAKNIHQRLAEAMKAVKYVQKLQPAKGGLHYSVVTHDAVTAKVRPALLDAGVIYYPVSMQHTQNGNRTEVSLSVRFVNIDKPDDHIDVPALGYGVDTQDKGPGKAISYAVKYALLKALGLETGDDADLEAVEHKPDTAEQRAANLAADLRESIETIRNGIDAYQRDGDTAALSAAAEAWFELSEDEKRGLWVAPTKMTAAGLDPIFTTAEKEFLKSGDFRRAHYGDAA